MTPGFSLRAVQRSSVEDEVYRSLREAILSGRLGEGKLVQDGIAGALGVSRMSVRAALKRLQNEHLVEVDSRGAYRAMKMDVADFQEVYALRALLEPYAARLAVPRLGSEEVAELRSLVEAMRDNMGDLDKFAELNAKFHRGIYRAAGQSRLTQIIDSIRSGIPPVTLRTVPDYVELYIADHASILAAIEAGKADEAAILMEKHVRSAGENLIATVARRRSEDSADRLVG